MLAQLPPQRQEVGSLALAGSYTARGFPCPPDKAFQGGAVRTQRHVVQNRLQKEKKDLQLLHPKPNTNNPAIVS
jgi:hypothetical protein